MDIGTRENSWFLVAALILTLPVAAAAQDDADEPDDTEAEISDVEEGDLDLAGKTPGGEGDADGSGTDADSDGDASGAAGIDAAPDGDEKRDKKKKKKKKKKKDVVRVGGRVFVRNTSSKAIVDGAQWKNLFEVSSARANIDLEKYGWLRGSLEFEMSGNDLEIRDVYLRATVHPGVTVQVGNFKRPMSPIALESIWDLPLIERGILSEKVTTANYAVPLNLGGRSEGLMVTYRSKDNVRPRVDVGLFNARLPTRNEGSPDIGDQGDNLLRDIYVRAQIEPIAGFTVGGTLVGFTQARFIDDLRTRVLGSLDVTLDTPHFRAWLEGFAGRTPFFDGAESIGGLLALRVLAAGKIKDPVPWVERIEPFVVFSALDPTDEKQDNQSLEIGAGAAAYFRKNLRLQLEYSRTINENEFPQPVFAILDSHVFRLQLGARFR